MMCWREPSVTVYGKTVCVQCDMTVRVLDKEGVGFTYINMEHDKEAFEYVTKTLGYRQAPAVVARFPDGSEQTWSGFRPDKIQGYAMAAARFHDDR